ncbi:MAG: DUF3089 domain-containing protein [Bacteroidaceae bacterium]|nr:DUF3089 domain-containing protein [Bacteroidaceae bacterium]
MKQKAIAWTIGPLIVGTFAMMTLQGKHVKDDGEWIPAPPDYTDSTMWVVAQNDSDGTGADVFYIVSTWEADWQTDDGRICHYADVWNPTHRERMGTEMHKVAAYMADGNNFYAPFYRHTTIDGWMTENDDTIRHRTRLPMDDVKQAFDTFQHNRDTIRPFILAGFSQGAMAVVELLKYMDDKTYENLVAAYVMGYKVTTDDTASCHRIRPALGEADTGVTICYNTVKDVKYVKPLIANTCFAINPVNWHTDSTTAILHDTIHVSLHSDYHVLVVTNYAATEYKPYKNFINVGDIHSCEPWLYSECLRRNFHIRTQAWRNR